MTGAAGGIEGKEEKTRMAARKAAAGEGTERARSKAVRVDREDTSGKEKGAASGAGRAKAVRVGTEKGRGEKEKSAAVSTGWVLSAVLLVGVIGYALLFSAEAAVYAREGLLLAVTAVLPSAIPSMLICDFYRAFGSPERITPLGRLFALWFGISTSGLRPFLLGSLCGFPMGAREIGESYRRGELSRDEAERLLPLATAASPPFIVGAVGGMLGQWRVGVLLLASLWVSTLLLGLLFRKRGAFSRNTVDLPRQSYSIVESISGVGAASVTLIGFISAFSVVGGFVNAYLKIEPPRSLLIAALEVTGGVAHLAKMQALPSPTRGALIAATLAFGGVSVMLQSAAFIEDTDISVKYYLPKKLLHAALAGGVYYGACLALGW